VGYGEVSPAHLFCLCNFVASGAIWRRLSHHRWRVDVPLTPSLCGYADGRLGGSMSRPGMSSLAYPPLGGKGPASPTSARGWCRHGHSIRDVTRQMSWHTTQFCGVAVRGAMIIRHSSHGSGESAFASSLGLTSRTNSELTLGRTHQPAAGSIRLHSGAPPRVQVGDCL